MNQRETGTKKEQLAAAYLKQRGVRILKQNFRGRQGEIDIVGIHQGVSGVCGGKVSQNPQHGRRAGGCNVKKAAENLQNGRFLPLQPGNWRFAPVRYDVVAIQGEEIRWIKKCFSTQVCRRKIICVSDSERRESIRKGLKQNCMGGVEYLTFPALEASGLVEHLFSTRLGGCSKGIFSSMNLSFERVMTKGTCFLIMNALQRFFTAVQRTWFRRSRPIR